MAGRAGRAIVNKGSSLVYSEMSTERKVVKTLKRGDAVVIDMSISGADGEWCRIREENQKISLGWVRCKLLDREQETKLSGVISQTPEVAAPALRSTGGGDERLAESNYMRNAWNIANLLEFNADQWERLPELAERTGVSRCIAEMEAAYVRYGLPTTKPEVDKVPMDDLKKFVPPAAMTRELMPSRRRCDLSELNLSEQVLDLATPEQREKYAVQVKAFRNILATKRATIMRY